MALAEALRQSRERHPEKPALIVEDRTWSYAELDRITDQLGARLIGLGIRPGDRVALHFTNGPEIVFGYYACFKIGAVAVPLNVRLKGTELEYILNHCGARLFLGQPDLFAEVQPVRPGLKGVERFYLTAGGERFPETGSFDELLEGGVGETAFPPVAEDAVAAILYTSGTTTRPKGVTHTHRTLGRKVEFHCVNAGLEESDIVAAAASLCHIAAFALQMLPALSIGATLLVIPRFDPERVLGALARHRATQFFALPAMYNALVLHPGAAAYDLSSLRWCLAGGDAVPTELQRRFEATFWVPISEGCGMTEVVPYCINQQSAGPREGSIGKPSAGVALRLVDDAGRDVPAGEVGEIAVKSEAAMVGYWDDPEATAATLRDGWLHTGDLGRVDADGYYWFVGRKKEIIVRAGSNISPLEIEEVLCQHPAVKEAGVVGVPDERLGETVAAYIALKDGQEATPEELTRFLSERIAAYKVPDRITLLPELPKGLTGKIHRRTLKEWASQ